jgi:hypothetical protein
MAGKMNKKLLIFLILCCFAFNFVYASETNDRNSITLTREFGAEAAGERFTLRVHFNSGELLYVAEKGADENGLVTFVYPQNTAGGVYPYVIKGESGESEYTGQLYYINAAAYEEFTARLADASDAPDKAGALRDLFTANVDALYLDRDFPLYAELKGGNTLSAYTYIAGALTLPVDYDGLTSAFKKGMILNAVERGIGVSGVFTVYIDVLEANALAREYYAKLGSKAAADSAVSGKAYENPESLLSAWYKSVALASVNDASATPHWSNLTKTLSDAVTYASLNTGRLYSQTEAAQNGVLQKLIDYRPFANETALSGSINAIIDGLSDGSGDSRPSSTGGGGGGGNTSKTAYVPIDAVGGDAENKAVFPDLSGVPWAAEAIEALYKANIVNGYPGGKFEPGNSIKREEFLKMLTLALNLPGDGGENIFADVDAREWYCVYVLSAYKNGIVKGKGENVFGIGDDITRQDAAVMLSRALGAENGVKSAENLFSDDEGISDYAKAAVYRLCEKGVINGIGENMFAPLNKLTRAEAAKLIYGVLGVTDK